MPSRQRTLAGGEGRRLSPAGARVPLSGPVRLVGRSTDTGCRAVPTQSGHHYIVGLLVQRRADVRKREHRLYAKGERPDDKPRRLNGSVVAAHSMRQL